MVIAAGAALLVGVATLVVAAVTAAGVIALLIADPLGAGLGLAVVCLLAHTACRPRRRRRGT